MLQNFDTILTKNIDSFKGSILKDNWSLLENSLLGCRKSFIELMQETTPAIFEYFYIVYGNNSNIALEETGKVLEKTFSNLKLRNQNKSFMEWVFFELYTFKNKELISELNDETYLKRFTEVYFNEAVKVRSIFESCQSPRFSEEEISKVKSILESKKIIQPKELEDSIKEINLKFGTSSDFGLFLSKNVALLSVLSLVSLLLVLSFYFWQGRYPKNQKVDFNQLKSINPPLSVIFEDIYGHEFSWEDDNADEFEENSEVITSEKKVEKAPEQKTQNSLEVEIKVETIAPVEIKPEKIEEKGENKEVKKEDKKVEEEITTTIPLPIENKAETTAVEKVEPKVEQKEVGSKETIDPNEDESEVEPEMVVLNKNEIPLVSKDFIKKEEGTIQLGDDKEKYDLKDFKDKKVVFYSFLEVKDTEKAKDEAFKILKRFGYKGEVLKREKDYIVLTATFPGKENHDRMIRKFNGLGTLYVGNDVSEFLELYKKELDKERSFFFPKYKPEDLPKEVTVNLYVFPKQNK